MRYELRKILNEIDNVLVRQDDLARNLWDVLTALRGPDSEETYYLKASGTVPIRRAAFPEVAQLADETFGYVNGADFGAGGKYTRPQHGGHAGSHIQQAAHALGLLDEN